MKQRKKQNNIDKTKKLQEQTRNKYRELSNEEKDIKREYGRNGYRNMSVKANQKLRAYNYCNIKNYFNIKELFYFSCMYNIKDE